MGVLVSIIYSSVYIFLFLVEFSVRGRLFDCMEINRCGSKFPS